MRKGWVWAFLGLLGFGSILVPSPRVVLADVLEGKVVKISDGDTVTILDDRKTQYKIRLLGIDSPEKNQAFGKAAKMNLSDKIFSKPVKVEFKKRDRYGRVLGKIIYDDQDINLELIRAGMAWHYRQYRKDQPASDRKLYSDAQAVARDQEVGLWKESAPIPPWEFRKQKKKLKGLASINRH